MLDNIQGKVIIITGASSGLGEAAARLLSSQGAKLALAARRSDRISALADELDGDAIAVETDVSIREQVQNLVDTTAEKFGKVDVIINNAGIMPLAPIEQLKVDEWDQMIDVNLKGGLYGVASALPYMKKQKSGHIINVSSVYGHKLGPSATVYCATKFAVRALSEGLRQEVKPYNIRTTIISPGAVATELTDHISDQETREQTKDFVNQIAVPADSFARMVAFAINEPENVDVNEILFRPTAQPI